MAVGPKEWDSWTDVLGQKIKAGDYVVYCVGGSGTSAALAFGRVKKINKLNSYGKPIVARAYVDKKYVDIPSCTISIVALDAQFSWQKNGAVKNKTPEKVVRISARAFNKRRNDAKKNLQRLLGELEESEGLGEQYRDAMEAPLVLNPEDEAKIAELL